MMYAHISPSPPPPSPRVPLTASGERPHALPQTAECTDSTGLLKKAAGKPEQPSH